MYRIGEVCAEKYKSKVEDMSVNQLQESADRFFDLVFGDTCEDTKVVFDNMYTLAVEELENRDLFYIPF